MVDKNWGKVQDEHFKSKGSRKTGKKWVESFIIQVWKFTYGIWIDRNKFIHQEVEKNKHRNIVSGQRDNERLGDRHRKFRQKI